MRRPAACFIVAVLFGVVSSAAQSQPPTPSRPNVVLIVTDDVGYGDIGSYGAPDIKTPNIDRLAKDGVKLTDFYAAPLCTPTRAALMTGRYQQRVRLERALGSAGPALEQGLATTGRSLPQLLKNNGYSTGLVGKWHLGYRPEFGPNAHGFDYFFGFLSGFIDFYTHTRGDGQPDLFENTRPVQEDGYMTDLITARALGFIDQQKAGPFFLEVAYNAAHWPFQPPDHYSRAPDNAAFQGPDALVPATRKDYVAMLERADAGVGQILQKLDALGLTRNTLVIFTNDNGGEWLSRNAPLFHRKDTLWEGGIRVPAIFKWPGRLPTGKISGQTGITMDLTMSILAATGTPVPADARLEGINLLPILEGRSSPIERTLFWRINVPIRQQRAVRKGDWKLLLDGDDLLLFNLRADIGERNDLATTRPDLVSQLRRLISDWEKDVDAEAAAK
ncbi:MAG TPA: sulfatase-like hydrolase/transferase [Vicinamibacterales bacterium]|nr:sulfatase-like hydrolase/transferase [Vicinamibacterales bacterium]